MHFIMDKKLATCFQKAESSFQYIFTLLGLLISCVLHLRGSPCDFSVLLSWKELQSASIPTTKSWAVHTHGLQEKFSLTTHLTFDQHCTRYFIRFAFPCCLHSLEFWIWWDHASKSFCFRFIFLSTATSASYNEHLMSSLTKMCCRMALSRLTVWSLC